MTGAQALLAQGRKEGREEGRREVLLDPMRVKFGVLPEDIVSRVNHLTLREVNAALERILTARTLAEMEL